MVLRTFFWLMLITAAGHASAATLTERQYRTLERLQNLLAESRTAEVIAATEGIEAGSGDLGAALQLQIRAQALQMEERDALAAEDLRRALATEALPDDRAMAVAISLGQIETTLERYDAAREVLLPYATDDSFPDIARVILAVTYLQQARWQDALPWISAATTAAEGKQIPEGWLAMRLSAEYQSTQYQAAAQTLQRLITYDPENQTYWMQLAGMYQLLNQPDRQLATLELAQTTGVPLDDNGRRVLASLMLQRGIPERAARQLASVNDSEGVRLRITALRAAREFGQAAIALEQLSETERNPAFLTDAARLQWMDGNCSEALRLAERSLEQAEEGAMMILAGTCAKETGRYDQARILFQRALAMPDVSVSARRWLDYLASLGKL